MKQTRPSRKKNHHQNNGTHSRRSSSSSSSDDDEDDDNGLSSSSSSLKANYVIETYSYFPDNAVENPLSVRVSCATTTVGGPIVSKELDKTGIMLWPATHLLCQYLCSRGDDNNDNIIGEHVLELGCGCGLGGITAALSSSQRKKRPIKLWVSTDADDRVLELCRQNYALNGIHPENGSNSSVNSNPSSSPPVVLVENLRWGDNATAEKMLEKLRSFVVSSSSSSSSPPNENGEDTKTMQQQQKFDTIVGADIVYPSTCEVLGDLLRSVDRLLSAGGTFLLSFASRDGPKTPLRLLEAASQSGFAVVSSLPPPEEHTRSLLPPLLDAQLLVLEKNTNARTHNESLGRDENCPVFPGLRRKNDCQEEEETWEPPFGACSDDDA